MVEGIDKLKRRLVDELPKKMRFELEAAMIESADRIVAGARLRVPVDRGQLRSTIRRTDIRITRGGNLAISVLAGDDSTQVKSSGNIYHQVARLVEFGTQKTPAQPFLLPAYHANRNSAKRRMRKAIRDAVMGK